MPWHVPKLGFPYQPGFLPTTFLGHSDRMSYESRLSNWFTLVYMNLMYKFFVQPTEDALIKSRFGDDFPTTKELIKKVSMVFVNQHYSLSGAKHLSPNVVELGGVHIGKPKTLDPVIFVFIFSSDLDFTSTTCLNKKMFSSFSLFLCYFQLN